MKQKIVIRVEMKCEKCKIKSMEIIATTPGVESLALGEDGVITVKGDDVDLVSIVSTLRKKIGKANVISLEQVKQKKNGGENRNNNDQRFENHRPSAPPYPYNPYDYYNPLQQYDYGYIS